VSASLAPQRWSVAPGGPPAAIAEEQRALREAAQARLATVSHRLRLVGSITWFGIAVGFGTAMGNPGYLHQAKWAAVYVVASIALAAVARFHEGFRRHAAKLVACLDAPFVTAAQFTILADRPGDNHPTTVAAALFVLLIMSSITSLEAKTIAFVTAAAALGQAVLNSGSSIAFADAFTNVAIVLIAGGLAIGVARFCTDLLANAASSRLAVDKLARYFSPDVARTIAAEGARFQDRREITVLFVDVRGFTAFAETIEAGAAVAILNEYFEELVDQVFAHGGTLDKYLGDGLLAYFGAPRPSATHADDALTCAAAMLDAVEAVNVRRRARDEQTLRVGIGLHSGPAVIGDVGARRRREFTVVGDTVNLASRVESLTKDFDVALACTERTRELSRVPSLRWRELGLTRVRGRERDVRLWTLERDR
jgi:adenylate cyclase